jgi:hypothetical protein
LSKDCAFKPGAIAYLTFFDEDTVLKWFDSYEAESLKGLEELTHFVRRILRLSGEGVCWAVLGQPRRLLGGLLFGLPSLRLKAGDPQGWAKYPLVMPEGGDGIEVQRVGEQGSPGSSSCPSRRKPGRD